jgi:elongation factor Ts
MAEITAQAVKTLREMTDLPMMMCKKALVEAEGDQDKAVEVLKQQAGKFMTKRADNQTSEGRIVIKVTEDGSSAAIVELQCESPPVAGSEDFVHLGEQLIEQLLEGPGAESPDELLSQSAPGHEGTTLNELFEEIRNKLREKLVLARTARVTGPVAGYVHHDGKSGVLFRATGENQTAPVLRDVAMHIAALRPSATTIDELEPAVVQAERDRLTEEALATGKPENIVEKIVDGRLKNFYVEQGVLVVQPFAKDDTKTVSQALAEQGMNAVGFTHWILGN